MNDIYDCIIIGMGPAGMSAALYSNRAGLKTLILESDSPGGLLNKIKNINNFIGFPNITGSDLSYKMFEHIRKENIKYKITNVIRITLEDDYKIVYTSNGEYKSRGIILACGKNKKKSICNNEEKYINKGVSYCVLCDANLYKNKTVILIGNDQNTYDDAVYIKDICSKVIISTNGSKVLFDNKNNFEIINDKIISFVGEDNIKGIEYENNKHIACDGVFICDGHYSNCSFINELNITDKEGHVLVDKNMKTSIKNIYACGDIIKKDIYQICTAINDGCLAAINLKKSLKEDNNDNN